MFYVNNLNRYLKKKLVFKELKFMKEHHTNNFKKYSLKDKSMVKIKKTNKNY